MTLQTPNNVESPLDYLRKIVDWCGWTEEWMIRDLPSIEAIIEFMHLVTGVYDIDCGDKLWECIEEDAMDIAQSDFSRERVASGKRTPVDPQPFIDFIDKYDLNWRKPSLWRGRRLGLLRRIENQTAEMEGRRPKSIFYDRHGSPYFL